MIKTNSMYKNILLCFFVLLFSHILLYNTPLKLFGFILIPPAIAYLVYTNGIVITGMICFSCVAFNSLTAYFLPEFMPYIAIFDTLSLLIPGFICGFFISKKQKSLDTLIAITISVIIFPLAAMAYFKYVEKFNFTKEISDIITTDFARQFQLIKTIYPEISQIIDGNENEIFSNLAIYIPGLVPCIMVALSVLCSLIIYGFSKALLKRKMISDLFFVQGLDCVFLPRTASIALLASLVLMFFETDSLTSMMAINVFLITLLFYMLQGLSLIEYFFKQKNLNSPVRLVAILGIIILMTIAAAFIPVLNPIFALSFLGMSDSASDFRKLNTNKDELNED